MVERLYLIVPWLGGRMYFAEGGKIFIKKRGAGRPQTAGDDMHVNAVTALLEKQRCWNSIELARQIGIAPAAIFHILKKKLKMRKNCARWDPHKLKEENVWQRMETAKLHSERYGREASVF